MSDLYGRTDKQIERLRPFFRKSCGKPRVGDRRVLSGIVFVNHNGYAGETHLASTARTTRYTIGGSDAARPMCLHE